MARRLIKIYNQRWYIEEVERNDVKLQFHSKDGYAMKPGICYPNKNLIVINKFMSLENKKVVLSHEIGHAVYKVKKYVLKQMNFDASFIEEHCIRFYHQEQKYINDLVAEYI